MQRSLLIGCGRSREKQVIWDGRKEWPGELVTLDMNPDCGASLVFDMDQVPSGARIPFEDASFDEIGAFNSMEHWGRQGDWRGWFTEMAEYHRLLKPGGLMFILVPIGRDALADPGHTRFFQDNYFGFLSQAFYDQNVGYTDYRWFWKLDFEVLYCREYEGHHLAVVLRKPT